MRASARRSTATLLLTAIALGALAVLSGSPTVPADAAAAPTTTVAATTTAAGPSTTSRSPTTTAVTSTTEAGPPPRASRRVAAPVDTEKIRPTSLPLRTMAIVTAVVIAGLAVAGFVYGKVRSRLPAVAKPRPATASPVSSPTTDPTPAGSPPLTPPKPLPPPRSTPVPPDTASEWAPPKLS